MTRNLDEAMAPGRATSSVDLLVLAARAKLEQQQEDDAVMLAGRALKIDHRSIDALAMRARALYHRGDAEQALTHTQQALRLDPEHTEAMKLHRRMRQVSRLAAQAKEAAGAGDHTGAAEVLAKLIAVDPGNTAVMNPHRRELSGELRRAGRAQEALQVAKEAVQAHRGDLKNWLEQAEAEAALEDFDAALRSTQEATRLGGGNRAEKWLREKLRAAQVALKRSKESNHYKVLGVGKSATSRQIKKAYRKRSLETHPDKAPSQDEREAYEAEFQKVARAYEVLSDDDKRRRYDAGEEDVD